MTEANGQTILVVDDDPDIRGLIELTLTLSGYEVVVATDGTKAVETAIGLQPAMIVMDVMMPNLDGIGACAQLRDDARTNHIPIILLTAKALGEDKVRGLDAGADDYIVKPFDSDELLARIHTTLRRAAEMRALSPLTGLPGNPSIQAEAARRVAGGPPFSMLYADLNTFKAYNDHYGFLRGDEVIKLLARILLAEADADRASKTFVGHIGGDDFALLTSGDGYEDLATRICRAFDLAAPGLYDPDDRERGGVDVVDRRGTPQTYPITTVSIGIATSATRLYEHASQLVTVATEMKSFAKGKVDGASTWAVDRRSADGSGPAREPETMD